MDHSIQQLLDDRILILDGAMGTMVQRFKLQEADFRGERFRDHSKDLKGMNDILVITKPEVIERAYYNSTRNAATQTTVTGGFGFFGGSRTVHPAAPQRATLSGLSLMACQIGGALGRGL